MVLGNEVDIMALRQDLVAWFVANKRDLPWRRYPSLYGTWVSEIMLQQTTVQTVIPYFNRFMARFPDVNTLAAADLDDVLHLWSGLGYYRRARMLHQGAGIIASNRAPQLPQSRAEWLAIPGVGDYAAGAIASIGLGEAVPALDANAKRVLTRLWCGDAASAAKLKGSRIVALGTQAVDPDYPGPWNEALMELGSLICRSQAPRCEACPVRKHCQASAAGLANEIPLPVKREKPRDVVLAQLVVFVGGKVLLVPPGTEPIVSPVPAEAIVRQDFSGLHKGLWGFPSSPWLVPAGQNLLDPKKWWGSYSGSSSRGFAGEGPVAAGVVKHTITQFRLKIYVHTCRFRDEHEFAAESCPGLGSILQRHPNMDWLFPFPLQDIPLSRMAVKVLAKAVQPKS